VRGAIALEAWQRGTGVAFDARLRPGKQKPLLMRRQQHIEFPAGQLLLDEGQIAGGIIPQSRAAVKLPDEAREPREAPGRGIADLDVMARKTQNRNRLPGRGAGTLRNEHAERF
jgi:hypothetical protein